KILSETPVQLLPDPLVISLHVSSLLWRIRFTMFGGRDMHIAAWCDIVPRDAAPLVEQNGPMRRVTRQSAASRLPACVYQLEYTVANVAFGVLLSVLPSPFGTRKHEKNGNHGEYQHN